MADQTRIAATRLVQDHFPDGVNPDDHPTCDCGWTAEDRDERWADHLARVLADAGLLADPGLREELDEWREAAAAGGKEWLVTRVRAALGTPEGRSARMHALEVRAERDEAVALCATLQSALLSRLADLTEAAGKARSTEWLRTCATLPSEEWPPAPAYRGPVVHLDDPRADFAAMTKPQLRDLRLRIVNELRQRRGLPDHWPAEAPSIVAERDALQARIAEIADVLGRSPGDATPPELVEIVRAVVATKRRRTEEATALQARIDAALARLKEADQLSADFPPSLKDWSACNSKLIHARAALQGDQPGQGATLGPRHPAGSPEGHFPTDPQMPGSTDQHTPVLQGDQPTEPEENR